MLRTVKIKITETRKKITQIGKILVVDAPVFALYIPVPKLLIDLETSMVFFLFCF